MVHGWEPAVLAGGIVLLLVGGWLRIYRLSLAQKLAWGQWFLLGLPWGVWLGLTLLGIRVNVTVILGFIIVTQLGYVGLGWWRRRLPTPPGAEVSPPEAPTEFLSLAELRELFGWEHFFVTELRPYRGGAIVAGNLRGNSPAQVHQVLTEKLRSRVGDAYRLFLVADSQERPALVILPTDEVDSDPLPAWVMGLSVGLFAFSMVTSWQMAPGWGLLLGVILLAHEAGHQWQARRYGVRLVCPLWVPTPELGSFGAVTRFATAVPHRTALWDIAVAGPLAGGCVSLMLLLLGLGLSPAAHGIPVESEWLQSSWLVGGVAQVFLGSALQEPLVRLHPLVTVGWAGLVVTALNLLPVGSLDGGRMVQAVYGDKVLRAATLVSIVVLGFLGLSQPVLLSWGILILFIQRRPERPNLEDITEPNDLRAFLTLGVLLVAFLILMPWRTGFP